MSAPCVARSVGVALVLLTLTGCSISTPSTEPEIEAPVVTTTDVEPADAPISKTTATSAPPESPVATTTVATTTTTVATELDEGTGVFSGREPLEEFTTAELDDLLVELDRIFGDLASSLAQEVGETINE